MLLYADDLEWLVTTREGRIGVALSYGYLSVVRYPFKWAKTGGDFRAEWPRMDIEYSSYRLG